MAHATNADGAHANDAEEQHGASAKDTRKAAPARTACTVCVRSDVAGINEALVAGRSASSVAVGFYGTRNSKDAVNRHARKCLGLGDAADARKRRSASSRRLERRLNSVRVERVSLASPAAILEQHERRYQMASEIIEEARIAKDHRTAIAAEQVRGSILDAAARLQGFEKSASPLINVRLELARAKVAALSDEDLDRLVAGEIIEGELIETEPKALTTGEAA